MLGQRLKTAIEASGKERTEVAHLMGVSEANLYRLFKKDSFEWIYIKKASEATGLPLSYFINDDIQDLEFVDKQPSKKTVYNQKPVDNGAFGAQVTNKLSDGIEELKRMFEEELRAKNQQIDNLQEMLKIVLGKSSGALRSRMVSQSKSKSEGTIIPFFENQTKAIMAQI